MVLDALELGVRQAVEQRKSGEGDRGVLREASLLEDRPLRPLHRLVRVAEPQPELGIAERVVRHQCRAVPSLRRHAGEEHARAAGREAARDALDQERAGRVDHGDEAEIEDDDVGDARERLDAIAHPLGAAEEERALELDDADPLAGGPHADRILAAPDAARGPAVAVDDASHERALHPEIEQEARELEARRRSPA